MIDLQLGHASFVPYNLTLQELLKHNSQAATIKNPIVRKLAESTSQYFDLKDYTGKIMDAISFEVFLLEKGYTLSEMRKIINFMLDDINKHDKNYLT